jgi:nitrogen fixation NifU-like protein
MFPQDLIEDTVFDVAPPGGNTQEYQQDRILPRVSVLVAGDFGSGLGIDPEFFLKLALQGGDGRFITFYLAAGELPLQGVGLVDTASANQDGAFALQDTGYDDSHGVREWGARQQDDSLHLCFAVSPELIDHFRNPRNVGALPPPAITVEVSNPVCGDILRLSVRMEAGHVAEVAYKVRGCAASIGAGSALTELLAGRDRAGMALINSETVDSAVGGLSNESKHAAALCVDAVRAILKLC